MTTRRRLIFSGTREPLSEQDRATLLALVQAWAGQADEIGVGDCPTGVDSQIREWLPEARVFVADWKKHGNAAGPMRNDMVIWASKADTSLLIAMPQPERSKSRGTWNCVDSAVHNWVPVLIAAIGCGPSVAVETAKAQAAEIERLRELAQASISAAQRYAMERT